MKHEITFRHKTVSPESLTMGEFLDRIVLHDMHLAIMAFGKEAATWSESGFDPDCWGDHEYLSGFVHKYLVADCAGELKAQNILFNQQKLVDTVDDFIEHYYTKGFEMVRPNWREEKIGDVIPAEMNRELAEVAVNITNN